MYRVMIKSPDGSEIELVATEHAQVSDGARIGAQALLHLMTDEMDLEEGYQIVVHREVYATADVD